MIKYELTGINEFYDGWLAWLMFQTIGPRRSYAWMDGYKMAAETGENAVLALRDEIKQGNIVVLTITVE